MTKSLISNFKMRKMLQKSKVEKLSYESETYRQSSSGSYPRVGGMLDLGRVLI